MELTEEMLIKACQEMKDKADKYPLQPEPLILHPNKYKEWKKRGWIKGGRIDWKRMAESMKANKIKQPPDSVKG
jgi:hypothetical protein